MLGKGGIIHAPHTQFMSKGVWGIQGGDGPPNRPPQAPVLGALGISTAVVHDFADVLQGVVVEGVGEVFPYPHLPCQHGGSRTS